MAPLRSGACFDTAQPEEQRVSLRGALFRTTCFFVYTDGADLNTTTRGNIDDQAVGLIRSEYGNNSGPSSRL